MRPSRIIVGEVRQEESLDLLIALNSGCLRPGAGGIEHRSATHTFSFACRTLLCLSLTSDRLCPSFTRRPGESCLAAGG
jgi:hypothetical protein